MTVLKPNSGLEGFVERNRADFDAFEPRADLWDALEAQLDAPAAAEAPSAPLRPLHPAAPTLAPEADRPAAPGFGWPRYAAAAAVALMLLAGGYGLQRADQTPPTVAAVTTTLAEQPAAVSEALSSPEVLTVDAKAPARRLAGALRRMEAYYASQIVEKKHELSQLDQAAAPGTVPQVADWKHELTVLDSTYQQLRTELYQNPDPDAVLEAMNRNLQIRLDILNQQLRTREQIRQYHDEAYSQAAK